MLTLSLLRHAKSNWDEPGQEDHERVLAKRGLRDAPRMGEFLRSHNLVPDVVLCSDAVRARSTLKLVVAEMEAGTPQISKRSQVVLDNTLYLAEPQTMLAMLAVIPSSVSHVMIVGHNPGLHTLALELVGSGLHDDRARLALAFPTAALAVIDFQAESWDNLGPGRGVLRLFVTPRLLAGP